MNRHTIAAAGLDLLDETGLDGLTVRKLAARLEVKSPALYWHFKSKHELLDEMARLLESGQDRELPSPDAAWDAWMTRQARARRRILLSRRDGARLVAASRGSADVLTHLDATIAAMTGLGFTAVQALRALTTINSYVTGFVLQEQADHQRHADTGETPPEDMPPERQEQLLSATPALGQAIREGGDPGGPAAFEDGLRMIIAGISHDKGRLGTAADRVDAATCIAFVAMVIDHFDRKIHLVLDRRSVHRSKAVREWVAAHADRIELHFRPPTPRCGGAYPQEGEDPASVRHAPRRGRQAARHRRGRDRSAQGLLVDLEPLRDIDAVVVTGDVADDGSVEAYTRAREMIGAFARGRGVPMIFSTGNTDDRGRFAEVLGSGHLDSDGRDQAVAAIDAPDGERAAVSICEGLRLVTLDTLVPGKTHGRLGEAQLDWLRGVLAEPAAKGTVLAFHHPPILHPNAVQRPPTLRDPQALAEAIGGTDVQVVLCGHYHLELAGRLTQAMVWVGPGVVNRRDLTCGDEAVRYVRGPQQAWSTSPIRAHRFSARCTPATREPERPSGNSTANRSPKPSANSLRKSETVRRPARPSHRANFARQRRPEPRPARPQEANHPETIDSLVNMWRKLSAHFRGSGTRVPESAPHNGTLR
ncbi:hypothetical protein GCM10029992_15090 [Glycomyces albus]